MNFEEYYGISYTSIMRLKIDEQQRAQLRKDFSEKETIWNEAQRSAIRDLLQQYSPTWLEGLAQSLQSGADAIKTRKLTEPNCVGYRNETHLESAATFIKHILENNISKRKILNEHSGI